MKTEALNSHKVNKGTMPKNGLFPEQQTRK